MVKNKKPVPPHEVLRTCVWLSNIFEAYSLSEVEFTSALAGEKDSTGMVSRWKRGQHAVKARSLGKIEALGFRNTRWIAELPIFNLLDVRPLSEAKLLRLVSGYLLTFNRSKFRYWSFPSSITDQLAGVNTPIAMEHDADALLERDDIYGLTGILYLFRLSEARKDQELYLHYLKYAYRAIPGLRTVKAFKQHWEGFYDCIRSHHILDSSAFRLLKPQKDMLERLMDGRVIPARRVLRPQDRRTLRYIKDQEPFVELSN